MTSSDLDLDLERGPPAAPADLTRLLREAAEEGRDPSAAVLPLVYAELRRMAARRMAGERSDHTLGATALVHEVFLRLSGDPEPGWESRAHFYTAAAEAMRRILVEHARRRQRVKRGGGRARVALELDELAEDRDSGEILAIDGALRRLRVVDARAASVVELRFFAGLGVEDTARALQLSPRTVMREWSYARAWLYRALREGGP